MTESEYIKKIAELWPRKDPEAVEPLRMVEEGIRAFPDSAKLFCMRGDLIQLSDGTNYRLADSLASYMRAADLDPSCAEAHESIGYYYDVIDVDLQRAEAAFRRAIELGGGEDSYIGLARVLMELGHSKEESLAVLGRCPDSESAKVKEMRSEIESERWIRRNEQ